MQQQYVYTSTCIYFYNIQIWKTNSENDISDSQIVKKNFAHKAFFLETKKCMGNDSLAHRYNIKNFKEHYKKTL